MQLTVIFAVAFLTLYNILPTLFFYIQPLKSVVSPAIAAKEAQAIAKRVDALEGQSIEWLKSYCKLLSITPQSIQSSHPGLIALEFSKTEEAKKLERFLPRAGSLISFPPAELSQVPSKHPKRVLVQRKIPFLLEDGNAFQFVPKFDGEQLSSSYLALMRSRALAIGDAVLAPLPPPFDEDQFSFFTSAILDISACYKIDPALAKRLATHFFGSMDVAELKESLAKKRAELKKSDERQELRFATAEIFLKNHPVDLALMPVVVDRLTRRPTPFPSTRILPSLAA